jgi:hypothetical protein
MGMLLRAFFFLLLEMQTICKIHHLTEPLSRYMDPVYDMGLRFLPLRFSPQELQTQFMISGKVIRKGTLDISEDGRILSRNRGHPTIPIKMSGWSTTNNDTWLNHRKMPFGTKRTVVHAFRL